MSQFRLDRLIHELVQQHVMAFVEGGRTGCVIDAWIAGRAAG